MRLIPHDRFDRRLWTTTLSESPTLQQLSDPSTPPLPTWPDLLADVFSSLYKSEPVFPDPGSVSPSHRLHAETLNQTKALTEWTHLRSSTVFDALLSAMGTAALGEHLARTLDTQPEFQQAATQAHEAAQLEQLLAALEAAPADAPLPPHLSLPPSVSLPPSLPNQPSPTIGDAVQAIHAQLTRQEGKPVATDTLRQAVRRALHHAAQEVEQFQSACATFGTAPGQTLQLSPADRLQLAQALKSQTKLQDLVRLLGRMTPLVRQAWMTRSTHGQDEVVNIELGQDLTRLVPTELIALQHPLLRRDFRRRFTEHALLQFQLQGMTPAGRGPLIILIDESESMKGPKELWSKAFALALIGLVRHDQRDAAVILFSSEQEQLLLRFTPGQDSAETFITLASHFFNGGTHFERPLTQAVELMSEQALCQADVVLLSDGLCTVSESWLATWRQMTAKTNCRAVTVLFGVPEPAPDHPVAQFSSRIYTLPNLLDDTTVLTDIAQRVTSPR